MVENLLEVSCDEILMPEEERRVAKLLELDFKLRQNHQMIQQFDQPTEVIAAEAFGWFR